eukprot:TRINITY_DN10040_c0_g1_i9.p1 TRINITY_DN10040_c0_g1~~TRINITY_DN10040_c0_g1_i9.p1  ORF type:complete len:487 (+),score=95.28 TRINITY_DN10040_c0_g1_i9:69-1463(+)
MCIRDRFLFSAVITSFTYESFCNGNILFLQIFFWGQIIFYSIYILNQFFRRPIIHLLAVAYHFILVLITAIAAAIEHHSPTCEPGADFTRLIAIAFILYALIKCIGDVVLFCKYFSDRSQGQPAHFGKTLDQSPIIDLCANILAYLLIIVSFRHYPAEESCHREVMDAADWFYYCLLATYIMIAAFAGCSAVSGKVIMQGNWMAAGFMVCFSMCFMCIFCLWTVVLLVAFVSLLNMYYSPYNDCQQEAPYYDFFMRYIIFTFFALSAYLLIVGLLICCHLVLSGGERRPKQPQGSILSFLHRANSYDSMEDTLREINMLFDEADEEEDKILERPSVFRAHQDSHSSSKDFGEYAEADYDPVSEHSSEQVNYEEEYVMAGRQSTLDERQRSIGSGQATSLNERESAPARQLTLPEGQPSAFLDQMPPRRESAPARQPSVQPTEGVILTKTNEDQKEVDSSGPKKA